MAFVSLIILLVCMVKNLERCQGAWQPPAGRSITPQCPHLVGPIHTPMMGEEASLLGALARAKAFPVASMTLHRG